jgi:hypothetical protein
MSVFLRAVALVTVVLPGAARAQESAPDTIRFRYGWTAGSTATLEVTKRRIRTMQEQTDSIESAWTLGLRVRDDRAGHLLDLMELRRRGDTSAVTPVGATPIASLVVDREGKPGELQGATELAGRLRASLQHLVDEVSARAPMATEAMQRVQSPEVMAAMATGYHINMVGFWLGSDLEYGSEYTMPSARDMPMLPGVQIASTLHFGVTERLACTRGRADTSCVRVVMVEETNADSLSHYLLRFIASTGMSVENAKFDRMTMRRRIEVVMEPWSLVPYALFQDEELAFDVVAAGAGSFGMRQQQSEAIQIRWERVRPPLHLAAIANADRTVRDRLSAKDPVDGADEDGLTALYHAASGGHEAVAERLVRAKADAARAAQLALARGDVQALRTLRRVVRRPASVATLEEGRRRLYAGEFPEAVAALTEVAAAESRPGTAHAMLADALAMTDQDSAAAAHAESVIALADCDATALRVMRHVADPGLSNWSKARRPLAAEYADRLARCAPTSGDAWYGKAWHAAWRADTAAEGEALRKLREVPLFSDAQVALARWWLEALPPRAIFVLPGEVDYVTLRMLQEAGERQDVVLVESGALEMPSFVKALRSRHGLPLPFSDAAIDSLDDEGEYWGSRVIDHWRALAREGSLDRGLAISTAVDEEDFTGSGIFRGNGALLVLVDTAWSAAPDPVAAWRRVRAVSGTISGPATRPDDPSPARRTYDLTRDLLSGGVGYLNSVALDRMDLADAQVAAADSLIGFLDDRSAKLAWSGRTRFRENLATSRMELRTIAFARGDRATARRQAEIAAALAPEVSGPVSALATSALLDRDPALAVSLAHRALDIQVSFDGRVILANALLMAADPDSAVRVLAILQRTIDGTDEEGRESVAARRFLHLPSSPADSTGPVRSWLAETFSDLAAMVAYQTALAEAMREDFAAADAAMSRARGLSVSGPTRCFVRNLLQATRTMATLGAQADVWYRQQEEQFPCSTPG